MKIVIWQVELVGQTGRVRHLRIAEETPKILIFWEGLERKQRY